jgi:hypothetical protein
VSPGEVETRIAVAVVGEYEYADAKVHRSSLYARAGEPSLLARSNVRLRSSGLFCAQIPLAAT